MAAAAILEAGECKISNMTVALYIKFATFPPNLVRIGEVIKKWQQFFENQDGGSRHLIFWLLCYYRHYMSVIHRIRNIRTKFGENWSNSKEIATAFRNSRWRQPPS